MATSNYDEDEVMTSHESEEEISGEEEIDEADITVTTNVAVETTTSASSNDPKIPRRGHIASHPIWNYFTQIRKEKKSVCNICKKHFRSMKSTNVANHLKSDHKIEFGKYEEKKKEYEFSKKKSSSSTTLKNQSLKDAFAKFDSKSFYSKDSTRYEEITDSLAIFIGTNTVAYRVVENPDFRNFISALDKRYQPPDRHEISNRVKGLAAKIRINILEKINESGKITICTDIWSRPGLTESFLGITAHFYSRIMHNRHGILLALVLFPSPHTGDRIKLIIDDILNDWSIEESKVIRYVTDSGSNMVKAMRNASFTYFLADKEDEIIDQNLEIEDEPDKEIEEEPNVITQPKHMRCFVHFLMCALRCTVDQDNDFNAFRKSIFAIVKKVSRSCRLQERLKTLGGLKLVVVSKTRWNSTYLVFERLLRLMEPMDIIAKEEHWDPLPWCTLEMYANFLKPFAESTNFLQGSNYPTLSSIIQTLIGLDAHLDDKKKEDKIDCLAGLLKDELERRFGYITDVNAPDFDPTYIAACFLDPTLALCLNDWQVAAAKKLIMQMSDDKEKYILQPSAQASKPAHLPPAVLQRIEQRRQMANISASNSFKAEISAYWNRLETGDLIADCIEFWIQEKDRYRRLYDCAIDLLGAPATSAPLEGFFSQASAVLDGRRYRLSAKNLEAELFLRINSKL